MSIDHNRIKVADLEKNQPNKILTTNTTGELECRDINSIKIDPYNNLDCTTEGKTLDARQGKVLKDLINGNTVNFVNDLTTGGTNKALSAEMGKKLNEIKANLASPAFTGVPTTPTAASDTNTTQIATTEFVKTAVNNVPNPIIQDVSNNISGIVNNTSLQELGGVDKLINGIRIGKGAGAGVYNTTVGTDALIANTTGNANTGVGKSSLNKNTTGFGNTGLGSSSLNNNLTGSYNTALGANVLNDNTTDNNTGVGYGSLNRNRTGKSNVAVGTSALTQATTGTNNTAIGAFSMQQNFTGNNNTVIGYASGGGLTSGNYNTIIGGGINFNVNFDDSKLVVLADGIANVALRKEADNRLLAPTLTQDLIISGGATSLVNKAYVDNIGAAINTTTLPLTSANLTSAYPNALLGFRIHCKSVSGGGLTYEKTSGAWIQYPISVVA